MSFTIIEMQEMQKELQNKHKDKWEEICPKAGKHKLQDMNIIKRIGSRKRGYWEVIK